MNSRSTPSVALLALAILVSVASASPASAPTNAPASQPSIAALQATALADDISPSIAALRHLSAAGEPGVEALRGVLPVLLAKDAATVEADAVGAGATLSRLRAAEAEMEPLRAAQLDAVANLTKDAKALLEAKRNYDKLAAIEARLTPGYAYQVHVLDALTRRSVCLALKPPGDPVPSSAAATDRIDRLAEQVLGMPPVTALGFSTGPLRPPADAARRGLWLYVSCRRIEAWNRTVEPYLNAGEIAHARRLNSYRELLGLLPYELDLRLTQSARRHSKEMIELWYFSHFSPTDSERNPFGRMARAGYADGTGENLHMGKYNGDDAFWSLFNSPSHHRTWIDPDMTAVGVGKWENAWTEDFGAGRRLMTASPAQRAKAMILGEILKPQTVEARNKPRDLRGIKFYDPDGHEITNGTPDGVERKDIPVAGGADKPAPAPVEMKGPDGSTMFRWQSGAATRPAEQR